MKDAMLSIIWFVLIMVGLGVTGGLEAKWQAEDNAKAVQARVVG